MNIVYLIGSLKYGGAEKQAVQDANMMSYNNNVFLVYFTDGPQRELVSSRVKLINIKNRNYISAVFSIARFVNQNNIQIGHSSLFATMIISATSTLFCRYNLIWHFHSHEYDLPFFHRLAYKFLARLPRVKKICFVNQELVSYFQNEGYYFPKHKIGVLHNSTTIKNIEINSRNNPGIIGFTGRLVSLKRVSYLIELAQYLINNDYRAFQIRIVGDGDERTLLEENTAKAGLQSFISFEGYQKDIGKYYSEFDLFVNPSQEECLSISLIDAGICGIPAVAFNVGGNYEIIVHSETGYIVETKEQFFEKVLLLCKNKDLSLTLGANARDHCHKLFSEELHRKKLENLYKGVLE